VKWLGDGLMVAFPSAADAVRCAITMQEAARRAPGERLSLRVGLHVGEAIRKESDYFGTAVVVARRLCENAAAGQILCSSLVAGLLAGRQSFNFRDLGAMRLKGLSTPVAACELLYQRDEPGALAQPAPTVPLSTQRVSGGRRALVASVAVLLIAALALGIAERKSLAPSSALRLATKARVIRSIAVLPLENFSGDPAQEYFADGMTEELTTDLAKISALRVISRTSVMQFKGEHRKPLPEIARLLNVDAVVEGSVLRVGDKVRITAQLIDAPDDKHLWADSYERNTRDVLALQDEVASAIARQINIELTPDEQARFANARPVNPQAHDAYLKGRYFWSEPSEERVGKALEQFDQAIKVDPDFAPAYSGVADAYDWADDWYSPANEVMPKAKAAVEKALQLDDTLAEAHTSLALIKVSYDFDWDGAETEFHRAIALNPSYAYSHDQHSLILSLHGRLDDAVAESKRATELDPLSPVIPLDMAAALIWQAKYEEAREQVRKALDLDPNFFMSQWVLGWIDVQAGKAGEAIPELQKARSMGSPPFVAGWLGYAYAVSGERDKAQAIIAELNQASSHRFVSPWCTAIIYVGLGDKQRALDGLEKSYEVRSQWLIWLKMDKILDPLRSEPRFIELLKKVGLDK